MYFNSKNNKKVILREKNILGRELFVYFLITAGFSFLNERKNKMNKEPF